MNVIAPRHRIAHGPDAGPFKLGIIDFDNCIWPRKEGLELAMAELVTMLEATCQRLAHQRGKPSLAIDRDTLIDGIGTVHRHLTTYVYADAVAMHPALHRAFIPGSTGNIDRQSEAERRFIEGIFQQAIAGYPRLEAQHLYLYPGIRSALQQMRDAEIRLVLYSESAAANVARRVKLFGIETLFDMVVTTPEAHERPWLFNPQHEPELIPAQAQELACPHMLVTSQGPKDDARPLARMLAHFGVSPAQAFALDDNPMRDVATAQSIGMAGILAGWGKVVPHPENILARTDCWDITLKGRDPSSPAASVTPDATPQTPPECAQLVTGNFSPARNKRPARQHSGATLKR